MGSQTGKLTRAREQIGERAKRSRRAAENMDALNDARRMLVVQRLEAMAEGLELAAKIVEQLMRD